MAVLRNADIGARRLVVILCGVLPTGLPAIVRPFLMINWRQWADDARTDNAILL